MPKSQQRKMTSIDNKFKALKEIENGHPKSLVAEKYGMATSLISACFYLQIRKR